MSCCFSDLCNDGSSAVGLYPTKQFTSQLSPPALGEVWVLVVVLVVVVVVLMVVLMVVLVVVTWPINLHFQAACQPHSHLRRTWGAWVGASC